MGSRHLFAPSCRSRDAGTGGVRENVVSVLGKGVFSSPNVNTQLQEWKEYYFAGANNYMIPFKESPYL